jgi:hypothetical protein
LLSLFLDRRREGGQLLGRSVRPGRTVVCSEESQQLWDLRQPPLSFGPQLEFHHPRGANFTFRRWRRYIDHLLDLGEDAFDLLVIDSVASFLPALQHTASLRKALNELRVISSRHTGVLLLHQTCAARSRSRARGPLAAFADILIDMHQPPSDRHSRRRHFHAVGRYPGTLQYVAAELNPEGTDYLLLPDTLAEAAQAPALETLRQLLKEAPEPLTRADILARWPASEPRPHADSLSRTLVRGCEVGMLVRTGAGTKAEAFGYTLATRPPAT